MNELYTDEIRRIVKETKPPYRGIRWDVVEYPLAEIPTLAIRIYKDDINSHPDYHMDGITEWINKLMLLVRSKGTPVFLEVM